MKLKSNEGNNEMKSVDIEIGLTDELSGAIDMPTHSTEDIADLEEKIMVGYSLFSSKLDNDMQQQLQLNMVQDLICHGAASVEDLKKGFVLSTLINLLCDKLKKKKFKPEEIFKGGHIIIRDDGALYKFLAKWGNKRISSHHHGKKDSDVGIDGGHSFPELLLGTTKEGHTFLQFESRGVRSLLDMLVHLWHFILHKITGKNIGPYGQSEHTEHSPIILESVVAREKEEVIRERGAVGLYTQKLLDANESPTISPRAQARAG